MHYYVEKIIEFRTHEAKRMQSNLHFVREALALQQHERLTSSRSRVGRFAAWVPVRVDATRDGGAR